MAPILAFDTSTPLGSVALGRPDGTVLARRFLRRQGAHAAALVPALAEVLEEAGVERGEIGGVVVGAGPGSFTGVRVAAATAKGLVRGLGVPLRPVSSLAAGAVTAGLRVPGLEAEAPDPEGWPLPGELAGRPRIVLFDARGERVYAASYRVAGGRVETLSPPRASTVGDVIDGEPSPDSLLCGSGALSHRDRIEGRGYRVLPAPAGVPTADALLRIAALEPETAPVENPGRWEPEYLRAWRSDGERKAG